MPRLLESNRAEEGEFMDRAIQFPAKVLSRDAQSEHELGLFSTESVLNLQKLIFAGSPLCEVLANIAQLVESQAEGMSCTIWLPDEDGRELHCAAAPSLPGFIANAGTMAVGPKGGSCGQIGQMDTTLFLVFFSRQRRHKVWLPSFASVIRERLFKMVGIWSDVRKDVSNQIVLPLNGSWSINSPRPFLNSPIMGRFMVPSLLLAKLKLHSWDWGL